jgi:hypothetical protein
VQSSQGTLWELARGHSPVRASTDPNSYIFYYSAGREEARHSSPLDAPVCLPAQDEVGKKRNEMLSFAGKWMEWENIILSEVSLAQKTKNRMFSLICGH